MQRKGSLKFKIISIVVLLIVLSNVILGFVIYKVASDSLKKSANLTLSTVAENVAEQIYSTNEKEFSNLDILAAEPEMKGDELTLQEKNARLHAIAVLHPETYENIGFYDLEGNSYMANGEVANFAHASYFKKAAAGERFVSNPSFSKEVNMILLFYAIPVYNDDGEMCGIISSIVHGDKFVKVCEEIDIGYGFHPSLLDMVTGNTISNVNDASKTTKGESQSELDPESSLAKILKVVSSGATGVGEFTDPGTNMRMAAAYRPVGDNCTWTVFAGAPYEYYYSGIDRIIRAIFICCILTVIVITLICILNIGRLIKPLTLVKDNVNEIATGNADLTKRINLNTTDEIGEVVEGFNKFTAKLQTIVGGVKNSSNSLQGAGNQLVASTENTSSSIREILGNIDAVHNQINSQAQSVHETAGAVNEIASNIESLERMIDKQSSGVSEASAAVEEMIGNISSVNHSMDKMAGSFEELSDRAQRGSELQVNVNEKIEQIRDQSETLQEANQAISAIAEQTNLLAMNAAIEAAHAGDAGKGFSVVADEIRKLSETSSQQSKTIGEHLKNIQESISTVVDASAQSSEAFQSVTSKIKETDELVRQVRAAMEEQAQGSQQISNALHSMNDSTLEVKTASHEMAEGNKAILNEVRNLQDATGIMETSMSEMQQGAKKIGETGSELSGISQMMEKSIKDIGIQVDQFKV